MCNTIQELLWYFECFVEWYTATLQKKKCPKKKRRKTQTKREKMPSRKLNNEENKIKWFWWIESYDRFMTDMGVDILLFFSSSFFYAAYCVFFLCCVFAHMETYFRTQLEERFWRLCFFDGFSKWVKNRIEQRTKAKTGDRLTRNYLRVENLLCYEVSLFRFASCRFQQNVL